MLSSFYPVRSAATTLIPGAMTLKQSTPRPAQLRRRLASPTTLLSSVSSQATAADHGRRRLRLIVWPWQVVLAFSILFFVLTAEAKDPVQDFCRRWGHQSAVVDDRLFIDGGYVNWGPIGDNPQNYTNEWFLYHNLSSMEADGMPTMETLSKNNSVPEVIGGALWADTINKWVYLFGGEVDLRHTPPTTYSLFAYDAFHDYWEDLGRPDINLNSPSFGGSVAVSEHGLGFYYGGWLNNATVPGWNGPAVATDSLIVYDMDDRTWKNKTGPDNIGRAEGVMVYIPAGDNGFLVYFGGVQDRYGNGTLEAQPMDEIFLFEFVSDKWYRQKTSGPTPDQRRRFCAGAAWAEDFSSYNIYLFGGLAIPPNGTAIDDVWILSIPTFQWVKWHPAPEAGPNGEHPHHSLTCNVVGEGSQMIIIGGSFPYEQDCDAANQFGAHGLYLGQQNPEKRKWETYNATLKGYEVPEAIIDIVGGNEKGGATATTPAGGFDNPDLLVLMTRTASASTRTATRDVTPDTGGGGISTGAIAGIAVGCAAVLISSLVLGWFCLCHRSDVSSKYSPSTQQYSFPGQLNSPDSSQSPFSPGYVASGPTVPVPVNTHDPAELPGAGNHNVGTYEVGATSPGTAFSTDGKAMPGVAFPPRGSHSSGHGSSYHPGSPSSGYPTNQSVAMYGVPSSLGGYAQIGQHSPMAPPTMPGPHRPMTPQELSSEPRDPNEGPKQDEPVHQTYYNPSYADVSGTKN